MRSFAEAGPDAEKVKQLVSQLPWGHVIRLLQRVKEPGVREWYIRESIKHGWSRSILELQIDGRAHARHGKVLSNFKATLPPADSDMAAQVFKDPYLFDFLGTADPRREREVEQALVDHIQRFLLELGSGFAFVGRHGKSPPHTGGFFQGKIGWKGTPGVPSQAVDDFGMMPPRAPASP